MWDSQTKIVDRAGVSADKGQYLEKLLLEYSIPKKGVVIILANEDYVDYFNPIWRNQGLHLNIRLGGIEEMSPEYLLKIMESNKYSNLVWISKRINTGDAIKFVWVASHEFQHLKQDAISHNLSVANTFLFNVLGDSKIIIDEPKNAIMIPAEFDAELSAFKSTKMIFGAIETEKYVTNPKRVDRIGQLLFFDLKDPYDIIGRTIYFLEKYRSQLEAHIKTATDPMIESFDIGDSIHKLKKLKKKTHNLANAADS